MAAAGRLAGAPAERSDDDTGALAARWQRTWARLALAPPAEGLAALLAAWGEPGRAYHNVTHLARCLAVLDPVAALAAHLGEVELALWYHDAIYDPRAPGNEQRSADWAAATLRQAGAAPEVAARVTEAILATCHDASPAPGDPALVVDVDLSILGAPAAEYDVYAAAVRQEYAWVPEAAFRAGRARVLQGFLERPQIYATEALRTRLEGPARENLARELAALAG